MYKTITFLFAFVLCFSQIAKAQNMQIKGTVYDSSGTKPLYQSLAMAVRLKDSLLLEFTRTDKNGNFELNNVPIDTFSLQILSPGYDKKTFYVFGNQSNKEINISKIKLSIEAIELEDVIIYANKNPIYYNGDTLVYVADSFKVGSNALVEDLLKKLPGVKVDKNGAITSQGKEITQVLVDGDEFFGNDPTIATKNLVAKGVESVKVYEKKSETASAGDDATVQVMDLRLKAEAKKGYFGKISVASDFQNYHEGELLVNKFKGSQKISVFALGSSTPRTNVSSADMNKFSVANNRGNNPVTGGIPRVYSTGLFYSDKIGKKEKTEIGLNYSYYNFELTSSSASRSKYTLPTDTSYYSNDSSHTVDLSESHKIKLNLFSQIDSLTTFEINPIINVSSGKLSTTNLSDYLNENEVLSRNSLIENKSTSKGISITNDATFIRNFRKPKRQLKINYDFSSSKRNSTGTLQSNNRFIISGLNDTIQQKKLNSTNTQSHIGTFTYTEPLLKKLNLEFEYLLENGLSSQDNEAKNGSNGIYTTINTSLTNNFSTTRKQNRFGTSLIFESRTQTISGGLRFRNVDIDNYNITTETTIHQNISNFLPKFYYRFNLNQSKRFTIKYNTKSSQPAINDLQLVQNNTNPNKIVIGNPELKPNYEHDLTIYFNSWSVLSGRYVSASFYSTLTNNAFASSTIYDQYGRTISQTVNVDGNVSSTLNTSAGFALFNKRFEISPGVNASYSKYSNLISNNRNTTTNQAITTELEFELKLDSLQITLGGKYTYNEPKNSISTITTNPYSIQVYSADITWTLPHKFKIVTDATYTMNGQRENGYNINYFVWNAAISRTFTKTDNLIVSLAGNDILNQNISALRTVNGNITTDNRTKIISRYFLLKLIYKFNNNKTKEEDAKGGWH